MGSVVAVRDDSKSPIKLRIMSESSAAEVVTVFEGRRKAVALYELSSSEREESPAVSESASYAKTSSRLLTTLARTSLGKQPSSLIITIHYL